jgi:esterase/lipase superfamily enzyme
MIREIHQWYSPALNKEMPIAVYGHYGFALLMIPTAAADYLEYERFELINSLAPFINDGKIKVFSVNSINTESWMNKQMEGAHKAIRHNQFNHYIHHEVSPVTYDFVLISQPYFCAAFIMAKVLSFLMTKLLRGSAIKRSFFI